MIKKFFAVFAILFLIYLLLPGPTSINNFPELSNSVKSTQEGDTIQIPNVAGYFSNNYRSFVTKYYQQIYKQNTWFPFSPIRLNHPPEFAFTAIKDQTQSTYLEEYFYPFRDFLFINGEEPFLENGNARSKDSKFFSDEGVINETKVVIRFYPSKIPIRIIVWAGICISIVTLWKLSKRVLINA